MVAEFNLFYSPEFTNFQIRSISFKDAPFELFEANLYENNLLYLNKIKKNETKESFKKVIRPENENHVLSERKSYELDHYFPRGWEVSKSIYEELNNKIIELNPNFDVTFVKKYIGYKINNKNVISLHSYKSGIDIHFNRSLPKDFNDPSKRLKPIPNALKYYNQNKSYLFIKCADDLSFEIPYAMNIISQQIKRFLN